ncbi:hypothetical protein FGO68_gene15734 [Halteria grandinella]|uniref:Uncharacterized protein n=1 Tax=Halteria grandinella TaxID=5974 RepID=A0A8J8P4R0_HALGN|nr:hypothetical protein FGO68_gene15734 [Halteria grandinella]
MLIELKDSRNLYEKGLIPLYDRDLRDIANKIAQFQSKIEALQKFHSKGALCAEIEDVIRDNRLLQMKTEIIQKSASSRHSKLQVLIGNQGTFYEEYKEGSLYGDELTSLAKNQSIKSNSPKASHKTHHSKPSALLKLHPMPQIHESLAEQTNAQLEETDLRSSIYTKKNSLQSETPFQKKNSIFGASGEKQQNEPSEVAEVVVVRRRRQQQEGGRQIKGKVNTMQIQANNEDQDIKNTKSKRIVQKREFLRNFVEGKDQEVITRLEEPIVNVKNLDISLLERSQEYLESAVSDENEQ